MWEASDMLEAARSVTALADHLSKRAIYVVMFLHQLRCPQSVKALKDVPHVPLTDSSFRSTM